MARASRLYLMGQYSMVIGRRAGPSAKECVNIQMVLNILGVGSTVSLTVSVSKSSLMALNIRVIGLTVKLTVKV